MLPVHTDGYSVYVTYSIENAAKSTARRSHHCTSRPTVLVMTFRPAATELEITLTKLASACLAVYLLSAEARVVSTPSACVTNVIAPNPIREMPVGIARASRPIARKRLFDLTGMGRVLYSGCESSDHPWYLWGVRVIDVGSYDTRSFQLSLPPAPDFRFVAAGPRCCCCCRGSRSRRAPSPKCLSAPRPREFERLEWWCRRWLGPGCRPRRRG